MDERPIYVLYGSQTGNAESIAKDIAEKLSAEKIAVTCSELNLAKCLPLGSLALCAVIVCSTTGNGDAPENANEWWRTVKLRCAAKDLFEGLPYAVLGLGDTNYDKYCYMGKSIDKRLCELGGKRMMTVTCADEATGFEETIESWKRCVLSAVRGVYEAAQCHAKSMSKSVTEPEDEEKIGEELRQLQLEGVAVSAEGLAGTTPVPCRPTLPCHNTAAQLLRHMPANIFRPAQLACMLSLVDTLTLPPTAAQLPRAKACSEAKCPYKFAPSGTSPTPMIDQTPSILPYRDSTSSLPSKARSGSEPSLPDMQAILSDRPGNAPVTVQHAFKVITSFADV